MNLGTRNHHNFINGNNAFGFTSETAPSVMQPLSIIPVGYGSCDSAAWSPFSAPALSPFDVSNAGFQYSSFYSPRVSNNGAGGASPGFISSSLSSPSSVRRPLSKLGQSAQAFREITFKQHNAPPSASNELVSNIASFCRAGRQGSQDNGSVSSSGSSSSNNCFLGGCGAQGLQSNSQNTTSSQIPSTVNIMSNNNYNNFNGQNGGSGGQLQEPQRCFPKRSEHLDMSEFIRLAAMQRAMGGRAKQCTFCRTNGEVEDIYMSHSLKDPQGRVTCPILMRYACPACGATGEHTHTKKYCPYLQKKVRLTLLNKLATGGSQMTPMSPA